MSNLFVCAMGIGTVFFGLICLIFITMLMGSICKNIGIKESAETAKPVNISSNSADIANKQEIIAASCAVIAEEIGTDVSSIKVTSFKKL